MLLFLFACSRNIKYYEETTEIFEDDILITKYTEFGEVSQDIHLNNIREEWEKQVQMKLTPIYSTIEEGMITNEETGGSGDSGEYIIGFDKDKNEIYKVLMVSVTSSSQDMEQTLSDTCSNLIQDMVYTEEKANRILNGFKIQCSGDHQEGEKIYHSEYSFKIKW